TSTAASEDRINESEMSSKDDEFEFAVDYKLFVKTADRISYLLNKLDLSECEDYTEKITKYKNKNRVPSISSLSSHDKDIANNVLKIRNAYHCNVHNRLCLNKESYKDLHVEITFMMPSIWASDMAQLTHQSPQVQPIQLLLPQVQLSPQPKFQLSPQPQSQLILPSFSLQHIPLALPPQPTLYNWAFGSQTLQSHQPLLSIPYNSYQMLPYNSVQPRMNQSNPYISFTLPSMDEFLKEVDEREGTSNYYQSFLKKFNKQRVLVKQLQRLMDGEFEQCDVDTVGA
ncbi:20046_t:CDS:2, partial [Racocetra fulgida]